MASSVFVDLDGAVRYARLLATAGTERGVIGPREAGRLWDRHLLNSAVVAEACAPGASVVDVGSGAGLPGVPIALARPDLRLVLLEPLARRVAWLEDVVGDLGLADRVTVVRDRAETSGVTADVVTSRAVAHLEKLLPWSAGLARPGGTVVAVKGDRAAAELATVETRVADWGLRGARVARFGEGLLADPTTAVVADRDDRGGPSDITPVPRPAGRRRGGVRHGPGVAGGRRRST